MSKSLHSVFSMGIPTLFRNGKWEDNPLFKDMKMIIIEDGQENYAAMWSYVTDISLQKILGKGLTDEENSRIREAIRVCSQSKIQIIRIYPMNSKSLTETIAYLTQTENVECVFINSETPNYDLLGIDQILSKYDALFGTYKI